jgi:hypothetical protein
MISIGLSKTTELYQSDTILESFQISIGAVYGNYVLSVWWLQVVETMYSYQELAYMHFMYGLVDGNVVVAHCLYHERYPT